MKTNKPRVEVTREIQCDIGHRIPGHKAACSNVHGHRYRIVACAVGESQDASAGSDHGMVADFGDLKELMMREIHAVVDHAFMVWKDDQPLRSFLESQSWRLLVMDDPPTAENLAKWCHAAMTKACRDRFGSGLLLESITVWETPNCSATYTLRPPAGNEDAVQ